MRILLKAQIPTEAGNAAIIDGSIAKKFESIFADQKPEAVYCIAEDGKRTILVFLDLQDASQLPAIAEPWFLAFNASIEVTPAFTLQELPEVMPAVEQIVKKYS
ncbi:MAG: hypothetical protein HY709_05470 [Candidatus Latescibacteria bacterium]|nr:hypothetical protein [Candidatus Latescibacterota bacterium]